MEVWGRRRRSRGLVVLTLMLLGMVRYGAVGRFVVEKNSITLVSPYHLSSKHDGAIGNFGIPDYGGTMMGSVVYLSEKPRGCKHIDRADLKSESKSSRHPIILLVDRGECYFAVKVWNGQQAGAAAVLVADNVNEPLITMDTPDENTDTEGYIQKIVIPTALIDRSFGDTLKKSLEKGEDVLLKLDWTESVPHPDERVEFELWTNSNDECGGRCDEQMSFIKNFRGHAQLLEKGGYTHFTPHYITWYCPEAFLLSKQCRSQCINHGRYCAPDPEQKFKEGYEGKDVVLENLRQLCVHRVANDSNRPWVWWDFVTDFHIRCSMKEQRYSKECAEDVTNQLNLPVEKIKKCMGDPDDDEENPILKAEQDLQIGRGSRGDITILPTLVINNVQYRGKLERTSVLKAICSGFKETTDPPVCLNGDLETNECLEGNGGCWVDKRSNITACKDTFRGRVCQCPVVNGVQFRGDGYMSCEAVGPARCTINNGGCWSETRNGDTFSACTENELIGCRCPFGFRGDGLECEDIDECAEGFSCQCDGCTCSNTWGGYDCKCKGNLIYIMEQDTCIGRLGSRFGWFLNLLLLAGVMGAGIAGYVFYKYRLRSYMDSEIMAIMSQYMPLDNQQNEVQQPRPGSSV